MTKVTLTNLVNLQNETTAVNAINANNAALTTAVEKTLSRDGTTPNTMSASLDMNSNQILNLPYPGSSTSPARLIDLTAGISTITALTGSSGHTVPFLDGNNTWSDISQFNSNVYFKSGNPWYDVRAFGAVGDFFTTNTDNTSFFQAAATAASVTGGILYVPPGVYTCNGTITLTGNVTLMGAGRTASYIVTKTDTTLVSLTASGQNNMRDIAILGKGNSSLNDTGAFGALQPTVVFDSSGAFMHNCTIRGGLYALKVGAHDAAMYNIDCSESFGTANVFSYNNAACWYYHCKFDGAQVSYSTALPFPVRANSTSYAVGNVVTTSGYALACTTSGTTGAGAPVLKNYGINITDGTVTWRLLAPSTYWGIVLGDTNGENHFNMVDFSGAYTFSVVANSTDPFAVFSFTDCVFSSPSIISNCKWFNLQSCELGSTISTQTAYPGKFTMTNCWSIVPISLNISSNTNNVIVGNNMFETGSIVNIAPPCNHYTVTNNVGAIINDVGGGAQKTVTGNIT